MKKDAKTGAFWVGLGILLSRISGLMRVRVFAHFFGNSDAGDAFNAALKIPNFLQNLFGEGVLSASFIPVYAKLIATTYNQEIDQKNQIEASQVASIIGSLLFILVSLLVIAGIFLTPLMIEIIAPGFSGEKKLLTIKIVQIIFPGTGLLVMSAWCLGILNSHRYFFLSYVAPVIWNMTIILTLIFYGPSSSQFDLAKITAFGLVIGSLLQFLIQLPKALKLLKFFRPSLNYKGENVLMIIKNFFPVVIARGVVQLSAYIDNMLASLLSTGAVSALSYAQTLYLLPISLFGMSIQASELPAMSSLQGTKEEIHLHLKNRLEKALLKIAFYIIPSVCAFLFLGNILVAAIFKTGEFQNKEVHYVWLVLIGSTIGLLASTMGRLYSSAFYSLKNTRTPLEFAFLRVLLTTFLGYLCAFPLPSLLGLDLRFGTVGLTASAGISGWVEFYLLRKALNQKIGSTGLAMTYQLKLWSIGIATSLLCLIIKSYLNQGPILNALIIFSFFAFIFFLLSYLWKIDEAKNTIDRIRLKFKF